ncbi:hypothetical protein PIB30_009911 [Stylosanthes scabra]|uniref:Ribonuclease H1 N-terminal domain-containing protein n=1 Tax=Stylosanthes scabra TaxID=79078 RepID=A0ABU6S5E2_9FABA|nr:hypothetical protein [Stylosanthes scabra]
MEEGKYEFYAVRAGRVTGIYTTWEYCNQQVHRYKRSQFKGFNDLADAMAYMRRGGEEGRTSTHAATGSAGGSLSARLHKLVVEDGKTAATQGSTSSQSHNEGTSGGTFPGSAGEDYVDDTQGGDALITKDMELYLMRACTRLQVGPPRLERHEHYSCDGHHLVAFSASLRCPGQRVDLVADGSFFMNDSLEWQDACYRLLHKLLTVKGKMIRDFNYRNLIATRQEVVQLRRELDTPLVQRLHELERERDHLLEEVAKFHAWFPDDEEVEFGEGTVGGGGV